jgi:pyridoxine 5-phosphate synthase
MVKLAVNVDHVATLRQARRGKEPSPIQAAVLAELAGAEGIIVHLREDRRHIQDEDVELLRKIVRTKLNLEMAAVPEIVNFAIKVKPDMATLVPERREELTTEGGLDVISNKELIKEVIKELQKAGIFVSLFIDPKIDQIEVAKEINAQMVELHTGNYAEAKTFEEQQEELVKLKEAAFHAKERLKLRVSAGHGLNYYNVKPIVKITQVEELNIGHSIISFAVLVGIQEAVRKMIEIISSP